MRYWWAAFGYGSSYVAWCNICDLAITTWRQSWGAVGLPAAPRKAVRKHWASEHVGASELVPCV